MTKREAKRRACAWILGRIQGTKSNGDAKLDAAFDELRDEFARRAGVTLIPPSTNCSRCGAEGFGPGRCPPCETLVRNYEGERWYRDYVNGGGMG